MRVLITGGKGRLAREISGILRSGVSLLGPLYGIYRGCDVDAPGRCGLDITDRDAFLTYAEMWKCDLIINTAAWTDVDGCERDPKRALLVNALGARHAAEAAQNCGAKLLQVSTDYVFDGSCAPYSEWDECSPVNVYGRSKLLGERYAMLCCPRTFVVRTAWLYGAGGNGFIRAVLTAARNGSVSVVTDQYGNPTNAGDLAHHMLELAATEHYGVYHCVNGGTCSRYEFASAIVENFGVNAEVKPVKTVNDEGRARRPESSALNCLMLDATVGNEMRSWQDALSCFCEHELRKGWRL